MILQKFMDYNHLKKKKKKKMTVKMSFAGKLPSCLYSFWAWAVVVHKKWLHEKELADKGTLRQWLISVANQN